MKSPARILSLFTVTAVSGSASYTLARWHPAWRTLLCLLTLAVGIPATRAQDDPASRRAAIEAMYPVMIKALEAKAYGRARNICDQAILWEPQNPTHHYNLACIEAQAGRLPQAVGALELAVALGFNDAKHMQADSDLAPLRGEAKFAELVRKVTTNGMVGSALGGITIPDASAKPAASAPAPAPAESSAAKSAVTKSTPPPAKVATAAAKAGSVPVKPAPNGFKDGRPVGLFFMTRFWSSSGSLEKAAWYFSPDGAVYQNLDSGFSADDFAAHRGPKGAGKIVGDKLEVTWADGKKTSSKIQRSASGTGFSWNGGIFSAVTPFEKSAELAGVYEGGESLSMPGNAAALTKRLELRADGSFSWTGVSFASTSSSASRVSAGGTSGTTGRWQFSGMSLTLTDTNGNNFRGIVFPYDDAATPLKPDRMFFGGLLYKRQP